MNILDNIPYIPCHPGNRGGARKTSDIKYLVFHYTGNDGDNDANNALYYRDAVVGASAHYFVDDDSITRSVADDYIAWAVGGNKWSDCPQTGGGTLYGVVKNANSISIEMCDTRRDGTLMATEATLERAAQLGRELMAKYNIPVERVVRHFDVTGKHCPAYFMDNEKWEQFKRRLVEREDEKVDFSKLTDEQVDALIDRLSNADCYALRIKANRYAETLAVPQWGKKEFEAAKAAGITDGSVPMTAATRLEVALMNYRTLQKATGKATTAEENDENWND